MFRSTHNSWIRLCLPLYCQGHMQDFSGGGPNLKISGILDTHAAKRHVVSSEAASLC